MKFSIFLSSVFIAAGIFAAPHPENENAKLAHRRAASLVQILGNATRTEEAEAARPTIKSGNWAGGILTSPPLGEAFYSSIMSKFFPHYFLFF